MTDHSHSVFVYSTFAVFTMYSHFSARHHRASQIALKELL